MQNIVKFSLVVLSFVSISVFSLPFPSPYMTCVSMDSDWKLFVYNELGLIRVYDVKEKAFSHSIRGLEFRKKKNVVRFYNENNENDLPSGVIFEANMELERDNAFTINSHSGDKSRYTCTRSTNL